MKKGITISILAITVTIMLILISVSTVVGIKAVNTARYEEFVGAVKRVLDNVNSYYVGNKELPTTSEIVSKNGLPNELKAEIKANGDDYNNLFVVDMSKLNAESVTIGKGTVENMDVFLVAENTNNVYYFKGFSYKGKTYYGMQF